MLTGESEGTSSEEGGGLFGNRLQGEGGSCSGGEEGTSTGLTVREVSVRGGGHVKKEEGEQYHGWNRPGGVSGREGAGREGAGRALA